MKGQANSAPKESDWYLGKTYSDWDTTTQKPSVALPKGACDCAIHVYDPTGKSELIADRKYNAPPFSALEDIERVHEVLGIERAVLVQPSIYGTDHRVLLKALIDAPDRYRGVALIDDTVSDSMLADMHLAGVRSARFNILSSLGSPWDELGFRRNLGRIKDLGWIVSLHATVPELMPLERLLKSIELPVVLDHLAYFRAEDAGTGGHALIRDLLNQGNWWMKVSRTDQCSTAGPPYRDTVPYIRDLIELAPHRVVWATDWPHVLYDGPMPNDGSLVDLLTQYAPDAETRRAVLVDNPAALFGF